MSSRHLAPTMRLSLSLTALFLAACQGPSDLPPQSQPRDADAASSPDGGSIAFYRSEAESHGWQSGVYVSPVDTPGVARLVVPGAFDPAWDPDGTALAFAKTGIGLARVDLGTDSVTILR